MNVEAMWVGSFMNVSLMSVGFTFMVCGFRPNFIARIDCASVTVNVRIALASISWNPSPPRPGEVVAMYLACSGRGSLGCWELLFMQYTVNNPAKLVYV